MRSIIDILGNNRTIPIAFRIMLSDKTEEAVSFDMVAAGLKRVKVRTGRFEEYLFTRQ